MILGILVIGFMEMVLVRKKKGKSVTGVFIGFIVVAIVTILLGLRLPIGFHIFKIKGIAYQKQCPFM